MNKIKFEIVFIASVLILVSISYSVYMTIKEFQEYSMWITHSEMARDEIENMRRLPVNIAAELRHAALTGDLPNKVLLDSNKNLIPVAHYKLDSLIQNNPIQSKNLSELMVMTDEYINEANVLMVLLSRTDRLTNAIVEQIRRQKSLINKIDRRAMLMIDVENELLNDRIDERQQMQKWVSVTLLSLAVIALGIISFLFINIFSLYKNNRDITRSLNKKVIELKDEIQQRTSLQSLLKNVLNSSANGIIALNPVYNQDKKIVDFIISTSNTKMAEIVNNNEEQLHGESFFEVFPQAKQSGLFDIYIDVANKDYHYHDFHNFNFSGREKWFEIHAVKNENGIVVTFVDVTIRKNYEIELVEQQKKLEASNIELEQFAYIASHDLKEPLRKIRAFGDRLNTVIAQNGDAKAIDSITRMKNAAERMQILIDELLRFSRISRTEKALQEVDLNEVVTEAKEILEHEIVTKEAVINSDILPVVKGDKSQLIQLFQNLLSNGLKYSKQDIKPVINISFASVKRKIEGVTGKIDFWKISVKDNGIGFDPEYRRKIFEIFQRLHGRTEYEGTGIGLAICEKIVKNHGGSIEANSKLYEGAEFTVYLKKV